MSRRRADGSTSPVVGAVKEEKKASPTNTTATTGSPALTSTSADMTDIDATPTAASSTTTGGAGSKRGKQSIRASDSKRKKLIPRCTSPSHFLMEDGTPAANGTNGNSNSGASGASSAAASALSTASPLPSALSSDPNAPSATKLSESSARIDSYLHSVGAMYYRNHMTLGKDTVGPAEVWVSSDYDKLEYPTLDLLISPLRKPNVLDNWCPREIALFESGICAMGKDFHAISNLITTKTCKECVDFYYVWKKSSHYAMWKNFGKPSKKPHANKEEQWKQIREQMKPTTPAATTATPTTSVKKEP